MKTELIVIGRREWVSFPSMGLDWAVAKVDTGARNSSLHAEGIKVFQKEGIEWVSFTSILGASCEAPLLKRKIVKSSNGDKEERLFIEALAKVGEKEWVLPVSLSSRKEMKCPILIGRSALAGKFLVNVQRSFVLSDQKK